MDKLYTIKELSSILNVPESTLRYYRDRFEEFIPIVGKGRKRRYKEDAIPIFELIIRGYEEDLNTKQIKNRLIEKLSGKNSEISEDITEKILLKQNEILELLIEDVRLKKEIKKDIQRLKTRQKKLEKVVVNFLQDYRNFKKEVISKTESNTRENYNENRE